jgi:hypothetical protein
MIEGGPMAFPLALDIGVLALTAGILLALAARLYPRLAM